MTTHRELRDVPDSLIRRKPTPAGEMTRQRKLLAWLERSNIRVSLLDVDLERQRRTNTVPAGCARGHRQRSGQPASEPLTTDRPKKGTSMTTTTTRPPGAVQINEPTCPHALAFASHPYHPTQGERAMSIDQPSTDRERQIASDASREAMSKAAASAVLEALKARGTQDSESHLRHLNPASFLTDSGQVDHKAIQQYADRIPGARRPASPGSSGTADFGQGRRGGQSGPIGDGAAGRAEAERRFGEQQ